VEKLRTATMLSKLQMGCLGYYLRKPAVGILIAFS